MPLLAQIEMNINELVLSLGVANVVMLLIAIGFMYWSRANSQHQSAELEQAQGVSSALEANSKTQLMVSNFAMKTSEVNADMNKKLLSMSEALGNANTKIAVLEEREKLHEERFTNLTEKIDERERTIALRNKTIAELRRQIKALEEQRDSLIRADIDKEKRISELNIEIARLKARLELKLQSERRESTQPIPGISQESAPPDETPSDNTPSADNADEQKDKAA